MRYAKGLGALVTSSCLVLAVTGCAREGDSGGEPIETIRRQLSAPIVPTITEPHVDGQLVNRADVHMETAPFQDPDPGQQHLCTDWEIWTSGLGERVWFAACVTGTARTHAHLGNGMFQGGLAGQSQLLPETDYVLRVRHRDDSGDPANEWSPYAARTFRTEADLPPIPGAPNWCVLQPGFAVEEFATGFQLPVNIAFVPNATGSPDQPLFYVTELYGNIKVVRGDGTTLDYATNLLNFNPTGDFPGSGEQGLTGIVVDPTSGDVFASLLYEETALPDLPHYPRVIRLHSNDGGFTAATQTTVLDMAGETQAESHQISNLTLGPDGKLYVHMGDGFVPSTAQDPSSFRGKILRLNLDGSAPSDNPFFDAADGINARDYTYALGFRNPFGGAWRASEGAHYEVENGPSVDRLARVTAGTNYGWDGSDESMTVNALFNWVPAHAPVNLAFIEQTTFHNSGFPDDETDHAFVSESGPTFADGPQPNGKRISEFVIAPGGGVTSGPTTLVQYNGLGKSTVAALAAGPNGLYFSELYTENSPDPTSPGAKIYRVRFTGEDNTGSCVPPVRQKPVPVTQLLKRNAPNLCIDVPGGTFVPSTQLQVATCNRREEQTWQINPKGGDEYEIRRAGSDQCIDIFFGNPFPGAMVTQFPCNDTSAQRFHVEPLTGGAQIRNVGTNMCVAVAGGGNSPLAKLELRPCNGSDAQAFLMDPPSSPPLHQLTKKESPNMCIDVPGASLTPGTQLQIWGCNQTNAQLFRLAPKAPGQVEVRRAGTNLCFDAPGGSAFAGVIQATCNSSTSQRFHAEPLPGGVQLRRVGTNLCVDVINNSNDFATPLHLFTCNGTAAQIFALDTPVTQLQKQGSSLCIDVPGGSTADSVQLETRTCNRKEEQTWQINQKTEDQYEIRRAGTGLCVDVFFGNPFPGAMVTQFPCNDTAAQRFHIEPMGPGLQVRNIGTNLCLDVSGTKIALGACGASGADTFLLDPASAPALQQLTKKASPNMCIDVPGASTTPGTQLQLWECNRTNAQMWQLVQKTTGQFEVRRAGTNLCFAAPGSAFAGLVQATCNNSSAQRFHAETLPGGVQLRRVGTDLCADVINNSNDFGTPIHLFTCNGTAAQIFARE
jgi:glucose/arabinose dehydrogenase